MAQVPTPRSYNEILGDMIDAFLSSYGLRSLKIGSPVLSMFESAAQSDLRSSEDIFELLESKNLDSATGIALDRIGEDEGVLRETESPATGTVTIRDTSFTKVSTKVFQGTAAPIVGSSRINVTDATLFPSTGNIYIGRGTSNYEGPLAYTSKLPPGVGSGFSGGNYWTLVLSSTTTRFHNLGESVILAKGGDRVINAGTIVRTPQANVVDAVRFRTLYTATIPDGETEIEGVEVIALKPGTTGNVIAGAVSEFASTPFSGAVVTNNLPFTNGRATESDESYRERIRLARQSRTRGTATALQVFATGVQAQDENKRVLSARYVSSPGLAGVLYIDDGTGYEERATGVALETFFDAAYGGEYYAKVAHRPIAKAFVLSAEVAPYALKAGSQLAFTVGGTTTVHTFDADEFRSIGSATAYEVVASINSNPDLNWAARTYDNGTRVAVFAKADTNEWLQYAADVIKADGNIDANEWLGFGTARVDTMRLYKNDRLLSKDGSLATIVSKPFAEWGTISSGVQLKLSVDGTPISNLSGGAYTFTDQDFVNANTNYKTVGKNDPEAWAAVFNYRIPGITATVVNGLIVLTSNRGLSSRARLAIEDCSLVTAGMFEVGEARGADQDYILDRNTGELRLMHPLAEDDKLAAGSVSTRAFLETKEFSTINIAPSNGHLWFCVDGDAKIISTTLSSSTSLTFSKTAKAWGDRERIAQTSGTGLFSSVKKDDWAVFWDPGSPTDLIDKVYRVAAVATNGSWFEIERVSATLPTNPFFFPAGGITFVRSTTRPQLVTLYTGPYTTESLTDAGAPFQGIEGASSTRYRTRRVRVATNTFADKGNIALVAQDASASVLGLEVGDAVKNLSAHLASVESGNSDIGTPDFHQAFLDTSPGYQISWTADPILSPRADSMFTWLRPRQDGAAIADARAGIWRGYTTSLNSIVSVGGNTYGIDLRNNPQDSLDDDRIMLSSPFMLGPSDSLTVLIDKDTEQKRYAVPMWRRLTTVGTVYGSTNFFKDKDNGDQSLAVGFGVLGKEEVDFRDFAVYMPARVKTHDQGDPSTAISGGVYSAAYNLPASALPNLNKTVLWRYYRLGPEGEQTRVRYVLPKAENASVAVKVDTWSSRYTDVSISLASGALRTGYSVSSTTEVGTVATATASGLTKVFYILAYPVASGTRNATHATLTLTLPTGVTSHGLLVGQQINFVSTSGLFTGGTKTITAVSANTIEYADSSGAIASTPNIGRVYKGFGQTGDLAGGGIVQGDFFRAEPSVNMDPNFRNITVRIQNDVVSNPYWIEGVIEGFSGTLSSTPTFAPIGDITGFKIFQNPVQTAAAIVAAVNSLADGGAVPIRGTLIGDGSAVIDRSSSEELANSSSWKTLSDGINYVKVSTAPALVTNNYSFQFKNSITAALASNSDWANEDVRLVPRTTKNVVEWLNSPAVSGLFSSAEVARSTGGRHVQITSLTPGSAGSVEVQGGSANSGAANVYGSASVVATNYMVATVRASDLPGFTGLGWVSIDNTERLPKSGVVNSTTVLSSIVADGVVNSILTTNTPWYTVRAGGSNHAVVSIERQGDFVAITNSTFGDALTASAVEEGDWVRIVDPPVRNWVGTSGYEAVSVVASGNTGIFRVVRVEKAPITGGITFWIENDAAVEQALTEVEVKFFTPDSVMPGDFLSISTNLWDGAESNQGIWEVVDVGNAGSGSFLNTGNLTVAGPLSPIGLPAPALGSESANVKVIEGSPARLIKRILSISPNQDDTSLADIKFTTAQLYNRVTASAGSVITALDKLDFPLDIFQGVDGYQYSTGLIAEVNRVIYGDPGDTATYPGVAAAGATVNIQGPLVKRIQVTLSLRTSGGSRQDIEDRVRSSVAAVINKTGIGQPIALSDLTNAATKVGNVISAVMVSPLATAGNDIIPVQPYEKPMVLDVDQDVQITFVGE
jgi:uncharacterized phage protein gp47/JayE